MRIDHALDELLEQACPSIKYRIRLELLNQSPTSGEMIRLQNQILQDDAVKEVIGWQEPDGWLRWSFHGTPGIESGIRLLCEKGMDRQHPVLAAALDALEIHTDRLERGISKVGKYLDDGSLGGSLMIRAGLFALAGVEDKPFVAEQIHVALEGFRAVVSVRSLEDVVERYRGKCVFKPGVRWPSLYHLRLLAFTQSWRTPENRAMLAESIQKLVELSPIPNIYLRYKSQLIAPAAVFMHDFNPELAQLDDAGWMGWFHRVELLARLGVVGAVPTLQRQADDLRAMLTAHDGRFTGRLTHSYFKKWSAYSGLMLEQDWKAPARRAYDLTFRSRLILHYADS
ncbi:MAG: hypothetical protein K8I30_04760 [Anaerolineae bacterium]|nr:hypothetical protein [Anaerolineae bacterium]